MAEVSSRVSLHKLDVTLPDQIQTLFKELDSAPIDVLVNNAGIYSEKRGKDRTGKIVYSDWRDTFDVNTLSMMRISEALMDNVACSQRKLIVAITSHMGSIAEISSPGDYAYRSSKAALNAAMKGLSYEVLIVASAYYCCIPVGCAPAWVENRRHYPRRKVSLACAGYQSSDSGRFYRYDGSQISW